MTGEIWVPKKWASRHYIFQLVLIVPSRKNGDGHLSSTAKLVLAAIFKMAAKVIDFRFNMAH